MSEDIDHVFLTRFNLPSEGAESYIRATEGWLRNRVSLFERYSLPSAAAQTNANFLWIVYYDPESPAWLRERIDAHGSAYTPIFRESVSRAELVSDIRSLVGVPRRVLITTNLDNDDGLANDFVDRLHSAVDTTDTRTAVYLANGLIKSDDAVHFRTDRSNAFCSVREAWDNPMTCWADAHPLLGRHMPTVVIEGAPAWLQVIHGANVSNRVRGKLVSPAQFESSFPYLLSDIPVPTNAQRAKDLLVARPGRFVRESARAGAKDLAWRLLGKTGVERLKAVVARVKHRRK